MSNSNDEPIISPSDDESKHDLDKQGIPDPGDHKPTSRAPSLIRHSYLPSTTIIINPNKNVTTYTYDSNSKRNLPVEPK